MARSRDTSRREDTQMQYWHYGPFAHAAGEEVTWTLHFDYRGPSTPFVEAEVQSANKSHVTVRSKESSNDPADEWHFNKMHLTVKNLRNSISEFWFRGITQ
jgi:hypothetical protein